MRHDSDTTDRASLNLSDHVEWRVTDAGLTPFVGKREVAWAPQPGSQAVALSCPIFEVLYEGTRGPGKTDTMLMRFYRYVGVGYKNEWRGIIFRRTYPDLQDIIEKSLKWFAKMCPSAKYNRSEHVWEFPEGEKLFLRHFDHPADYWKYHGHAYTFMGWEELCTWPSDECMRPMLSVVRSSVPGIPLTVFNTANPYGPGHNWVKSRYRLPVVNPKNGGMVGPIIEEDGLQRVAIHGELRENRVLLHAQPDYVKQLRAAAKNEAQFRAWVHGDWNIVAGGMFDDLWDAGVHVLPSFPPEMVPKQWRLDRALDWGSSKPFSVGWWAESNGEPLEIDGILYGSVRGDLIRVAEWYGCDQKKPNVGIRMLAEDVAKGIVAREVEWRIAGRVGVGMADSSIFDPYDGTKSIAGDMKTVGVQWEKVDKSPGSRKQGWEQMRKLLKNAKAEGGPRENPGIFFLDRCADLIRTVPVLSRMDKDLDDIDTEAEDHIADEVRYRIRRKSKQILSGSMK